jgi:hypothetical protein
VIEHLEGTRERGPHGLLDRHASYMVSELSMGNFVGKHRLKLPIRQQRCQLLRHEDLSRWAYGCHGARGRHDRHFVTLNLAWQWPMREQRIEGRADTCPLLRSIDLMKFAEHRRRTGITK